jgi:septal ring factor EnvC (AmiA/AmiB activator)
MEYLTSIPVKMTLSIAVILFLIIGWRYFPKRKIFVLFCLILAGAGFFLVTAHRQAPKPAISEEAKYTILQQQKIFTDWYTDYKKNIDHISHYWQRYHSIMQSFKQDDISIQTVYTRLQRLQEESGDLKNKLSQLEPPPGLNDENYALTAKIIQKTRDYVNREQEVIAKTKDAADPAKLKTNDQPEQVRQLDRVMILYSPVNLNIADEISQLNANFSIPDES